MSRKQIKIQRRMILCQRLPCVEGTGIVLCRLSLFTIPPSRQAVPPPFTQGRQNGSPLSPRQNRHTKWTVEDACPYNSRHTFPHGKSGRFVNRPYGTHPRLALQYFTLPTATFHAAKGGISQKHRFYFTLPKATFHCAIGAIHSFSKPMSIPPRSA